MTKITQITTSNQIYTPATAYLRPAPAASRDTLSSQESQGSCLSGLFKCLKALWNCLFCRSPQSHAPSAPTPPPVERPAPDIVYDIIPLDPDKETPEAYLTRLAGQELAALPEMQLDLPEITLYDLFRHTNNLPPLSPEERANGNSSSYNTSDILRQNETMRQKLGPLHKIRDSQNRLYIYAEQLLDHPEKTLLPLQIDKDQITTNYNSLLTRLVLFMKEGLLCDYQKKS